MHFKEPKNIELKINNRIFKGIIDGTAEGVKFKSNDEEFLKHFPGGEFDSLDYEGRKTTFEQKEIIDTAKKIVKGFLS